MALRQVDLHLTPESFKPVGTAPKISAAPLPERYALLEDALEQAVRDRIITPLPSREPTSGVAYACARVATIRTRMYLLGYLDEDNHQEILGDALKQAIATFQKEASLADRDIAVDGWVGEQSWTALQELVSFEEPSNLQRWFVEGVPCPALRRAIQLRLFAFGLTGYKPQGTADDQAIASGLRNFAALSDLLGCGDRLLEPRACFETISFLFDQDELVHRLANTTASKDHATLATTHAFILNITKAELWLHGYGPRVAPRGYSEEDAFPEDHDRRFELQTGELHKSLVQFWKDHDSQGPESRALKHLTFYFPEFFAAIDGLINEEPDSEKVLELLEEKKRHGEDPLQKVWNHIGNFASIVWDGIKRAWRWIISKIRQGAAFIRNISRVAYQYILQSFEAVKAIVEGIADSLSFFSSLILPLPKRGLGMAESDGTQIGRDADFDFIALVDRDSRPADTERVAAYLESKSSLFSISCHFLAELLEILLDMFKGVFSGWMLLLMALLKLYKSIRQQAPEFIRARLQEHDILAHQALQA